MLIDEAQAQRTAAMDRGSEQNSPELDNGAEINIGGDWANESGSVDNHRCGDKPGKPHAGLPAGGGKQKGLGVDNLVSWR